MKIYKLLNISVAIILISCSTPVTRNERLEDKFAEMIRNNLKDHASRNSADLKIYSLNILKIDTITGKTLDSQLVIKTSDRLEICNAMADLYLSMAATTARIKALDKKAKKSVLPGVTSEDMEDDSYKAGVYKDSAKFYETLLDSLKQTTINNNRISDTLYQVRSFLQATEMKDKDSTSQFGITYYYITKDNKVLSLTDIESGKLDGISN